MINVDQATGDIVINGFEQGIASDPYSGISEMRNINIDSVPGEAHVNFSTVTATLPACVFAITSTSGTTINYTLTSGTIQNGQAVYLTGSSLPGGLTAGAVDDGPFYWITNLNTSAGTFNLTSLYPTIGATAISTSSTGTATGTTINMGTPLQWAYGLSATGNIDRYYILDNWGKAWFFQSSSSSSYIYLGNTHTRFNSSGNTNGAFGMGMVWYISQYEPPITGAGSLGYLFVWRNVYIDVLDVQSGTWTYAWNSNQLNTTYTGALAYHTALVDNSFTIYYCDGSFVGSITQVDGKIFDPSNSSTYNIAYQALAIPTNDVAISLEDLGDNLLVGGIRNYIYPWNKTTEIQGTSYNSNYSTPLWVAEPGIIRMVTANAKTYIFAGNRGKIYVTNGSQVDLLYKIPDHLSGTVSPYFAWGGVGVVRNNLYFGVQGYDNGGNAINGYGGLWKLDLGTQAFTCFNTLSYDSSGTHGGYASVFIPWPTVLLLGRIDSLRGSLMTEPGGGYMVGWANAYPTATSSGMDISSSDPYTNSTAYIVTDLISIGTKYKPVVPDNQLELKLATPLKTGESIAVYVAPFFSTNSSDYTQLKTQQAETSTSGAAPVAGSASQNVLSDMYFWPRAFYQWLSIKVVLTGIPFSSSPSYNRLREIRIHGATSKITSFKQLQTGSIPANSI